MSAKSEMLEDRFQMLLDKHEKFTSMIEIIEDDLNLKMKASFDNPANPDHLLKSIKALKSRKAKLEISLEKIEERIDKTEDALDACE